MLPYPGVVLVAVLGAALFYRGMVRGAERAPPVSSMLGPRVVMRAPLLRETRAGCTIESQLLASPHALGPVPILLHAACPLRTGP